MPDGTSAATGIGSLLSPIGLISTGLGLVGSIGKMFGRSKANRELEKLLAKRPEYRNQAGLAQTLLNARMPGAAQAERNIYQQEANQIANAQRGATSGNQLLLAGAGATGMANQAFGQLGQAEAADYQRRYGNVVSAQQQDYEAAMQRYAQEAQIRGAQQENRQNTWGDVSGLGFGFANLAAQGAFNKVPSTNPQVQSPTVGTSTSRTSQLPTTQVPYNWLNASYNTQQPFSSIPSTLLSMGYGGQQPYSNIPRNVLSGGYNSPYGGSLY